MGPSGKARPISADLVGDVAVARNAVGSDKDGPHIAQTKTAGHHTVGNEGGTRTPARCSPPRR